MGARGSGGLDRRPVYEVPGYRADVRGRRLDAHSVLRLTFGGSPGDQPRRARAGRVDIRPELRRVAMRVHPF